jgi:NADH-quinone oxidoreductase subunit M
MNASLPWLSLLVFVPFLGCLAVAWMPGLRAGAARAVALGFQVVALLATLAVTVQFETTRGGLQFVERHAWIPTLGVEYFLGLDGLGLVSVWLAAFVPLLAVAVGEPAAAGRERVHYALVLGLQAGLFGAFTALNFFHWFLFWELSLVPAYLLVRLFGGPKAGPASFQFFVYTMVGSATLLLGFLALRAAAGSFDFVELAAFGRSGRLASALAEQVPWAGLFASKEALAIAVFLGVLLGFAVKVPLWPFHTWLPDTYTAAPSTVTMLLTGAMSKMGVYGVLRIVLPIFPDQFRVCQGPLVLLALATVVLPALAAFAQSDLKRMLAYSSVNHLGYCLLAAFALAPGGAGSAWVNGTAAPALNGVLLQMFNHGLTASALFAGVAMLERRAPEARQLGRFGGLRRVAPVYCGLMGISLFASLGLPGLNGFVGEFLIFKGVFGSAPGLAAAALIGLLATAVFLLSAMQRLFHGPLETGGIAFADLTTRERWLLGVPVALMFVFGLFPDLILRLTNPTVLEIAGAR